MTIAGLAAQATVERSRRPTLSFYSWMSLVFVLFAFGGFARTYLIPVATAQRGSGSLTGGRMADVNDVLAANRAAVNDLVAAAERSAATWTTPRAPGKWSPSQVVEHVARGMDEGANIVAGAPSIPMPPAFLRPLARLVFNRVLKKDAFPKGFKAHKALNPSSGPATPAEARVRLERAYARFDQECRRRAASGPHLVSTGFGMVSVEDLVRFTVIHTRHHCKQMTGPA
jgi:hypothetical protein